jgi:hypothetical protein
MRYGGVATYLVFEFFKVLRNRMARSGRVSASDLSLSPTR